MDNIIHECSYHRMKQTRHGTMLYNIHDQFIGRSLDTYGEWSWFELQLLEPYADGKIVYDVGANIGTHTLSFASVAKQVYAFEPMPQTFGLLVANIMLNVLPNATPCQLALSDSQYTGKMRLFEADKPANFGASALSSIGNVQVNCVPLDDISGILPPQLIKIDAEGHEYEILCGARKTIEKHRPVLYVECDRESEKERVLQLIESLGYTWRWDLPWLYNPANYYGKSENIFPHIWSEMLLCLPKEKEYAS